MKIEDGYRSSHVASGMRQGSIDRAKEQQEEYARVIKELKSAAETPQERQERLERQKKEAEAKRKRTQKANQLRSRIAYLRSRLMSNRHDHSAAGELAMAKTQLYWTMNPMTYE